MAIMKQPGEERAFQYLMQQLSVAVQRGNAVAVGVVLHQTFLCSVIVIIFFSIHVIIIVIFFRYACVNSFVLIIFYFVGS